jgi:putative polymerase
MELDRRFYIQPVPARAISAPSSAGMSLVFAAVTFNMVLCFISTCAAIHMSNVIVIVSETAILTAGLYVIRHRISQQSMRITGIAIVILIGMKIINPGLDLKIIHDLSITYIFFELGVLSTLQNGNRLLWIIMAMVVPFSAFEVLTPEQFGSVFNVWSYYVDKGVIAATTINYSDTTSFISGIRGGQEVRSFFPFLLGPQRFSSVFLEPVSMGNFSVICFAWCISTRIGRRWVRGCLIFLAAFCAVLADSRFSFTCWALMLLFRLTPLHRSRLVIFCLPLLAMFVLLIVGSLHELPGVQPSIMDDNFPGRLLFSGRLLDYWNLRQWFGLAPSQVYTSDTGYAYVVNNLGLPLALFLLGIFAVQMPRTPEASSMKAMITVYMATSLCIGANMFTIKTAALCWFLYGAANALPFEGATDSVRTHLWAARQMAFSNRSAS